VLGARCLRGRRGRSHRRSALSCSRIGGHAPQPSVRSYPSVVALTFDSSPTSSVGVELELGLVDLSTGELVCAASEIIDELAAPFGGKHPKIKQELFESTIEVCTEVHATVAQARADLEKSVAELQHAAARRELGIVGGGLHPYSKWHDLTRSAGERYDSLVERVAWPVRRMMAHGMHVHVGVRSPEKSISIMNALSDRLPLLLALSASSPYWHGLDTGLASTRTKVFDVMPNSGLPPLLVDWREFTSLHDRLLTTGSIETARDIHWDVRPRPEFGTVELRMFDAPPTLGEVAALAALSQCLVQRFDEIIDSGYELPIPSDWVRQENKWRAARWGVDADMVIDDEGHTRAFREVITDLVEELAPTAEGLQCTAELGDILAIMESGPSYVRQRAILDRGGDLLDVVLGLRNEMLADS
jgi:carboxylate-amine ligase